MNFLNSDKRKNFSCLLTQIRLKKQLAISILSYKVVQKKIDELTKIKER